jgi:hypothetical protein
MNLSLESILPEYLVHMARVGDIGRYLVCGVDVYVSSSGKRHFSATDPCFQVIDGKYFFGRSYEVIDLICTDRYYPVDDIFELKAELVRLGVHDPNLLEYPVIYSDEDMVAFVLTPLDRGELDELAKNSCAKLQSLSDRL